MFIGHYAVGLAGKRVSAGPSLGTWFLAAQWVDLIWPFMLLLGVEQVRIDPGNTTVTPLEFTHYPYTHSLLFAVFWALAFAGVYRFVFKKDGRTALWLGAAVFSHWVLDIITHRPDLPLYPGSDIYLGLELWASRGTTLVVEGSLFAVAVWLFTRGTVFKSWKASAAFWGMTVLLVVIYLGNLFGPPPELGMEGVVAWMALSQWLFVAWAYWIDRLNRA